MESDQQQIVDLIHKMRTEQVSQAQEKLMSLVLSSSHSMQKIFNVIKNNQLDPWVKTIASTFLNRFICQKLQQYGYKNMFTAISNLMGSYQISSTDKRCFQRSLVTLIQYIKEPQQIQQWKNFILKHVNDPLLLDTGLLLISCTAVSDLPNDFLCVIVQQTFQLTLNRVQVSIQNSMILNQLIKNWVVVFDKLKIVQNQSSAKQTLKKISCSNNLAQIIFSIYQLSSPGQIWLCIKPQLYELNILKYSAAQLHKKIGQYCNNSKISAEKCPSLKMIIQYYNKIKNTTAVVASNMQIIQNFQCQDLITQYLSLLIVYIKSQKQKSISFQQLNILMHIICFPFLGTRDQELYIFEDSPVQFNALIQDLCDKQTFGILKTQAAKLLQTISDYNSEATAKAIQFCIQCIKIKMGFVKSFESLQIKILQIQTAFQILAIFSFGLQNYPHLLQDLKVILCDKRLMDLGAIELSKIFLFLAYNYGQIFKNPSEGNMWIQFALQYQAHPTARYIGLDFISNICDQYFTQTFFNQLVKLILQCSQKQSGQVWNIIIKIFNTQKQKITQALCLNMVNTVLLRVQREISLLNQKSKQSSIDIINALHILRKIIQEKQYMHNKQALKQSIFRITIIFPKAIQLNIEDEIIKILNQYIKLDINSETIAQQIFINLLPQILTQFKKQQYHQKAYFVLFNQLIYKYTYQQIKPIIKTLLTGLMFHLFDMSEHAQKLKMKISIANILTLLQNLLSIHGFQMSGENDNPLCQIGAMCIRLFPAKEDEKVFSKALLAKAINLMFICHLYSRAQNTIQYLIKYARQNIFHKYDAYVLVKLLSKAVFAEDNINIVIEYLNLMIQITDQQERNNKKGHSVKTAKGKMKIKREEQYNKILEKISSPFIDFQVKRIQTCVFSIKKQVIECLTNMKSNNVDTYKLIVMNMNQQQKAKLAQIINQTVEVDGRNRIIRKVVGVKALQNNLQIKDKAQTSDVQQNQQQSQQRTFKRERVLRKKKQTKKPKNNQINIQ